MYYRKEDDKLVFLWRNDLPGTWELNTREELPYAIVELISSPKRTVVRSELLTPKLKKLKSSGYSNKRVIKKGEEAVIIQEEKTKIEELIQKIMGADFVLAKLKGEDAKDYVLKDISTCLKCKKKYKTDKKYHRYCPDCWDSVNKK